MANQQAEVQNYQEAVKLTKEVKRSNDLINSFIGVQSRAEILNSIHTHASQIPHTIAKIERYLAFQQSIHKGPDGLRRMASLKQHLLIQTHRRNMLLQSVNATKETESAFIEAHQGHSVKGCISKQSQNQLPTALTLTAHLLPSHQNLGVVIAEADQMAINEEDLKNQLFLSKTSKKGRIGSWLESNRKKIAYFLLFTLLKIVVWLVLFA